MMNRSTSIGCLVTLLSSASMSQAAKPALIDRPTPPPCAADGKCYPNVNEWGYYPGRWRQWPGVDLRLIPAPAAPTPAEQLGPDLSPYEAPTPEKEDEQAPPSTTKRETEEAAPEAGGASPPADGIRPPPGPSGPVPGPVRGTESPPSVPYSESTSDSDPPPTPPFAVSADVEPSPQIGRGALSPRPELDRRTLGSDPPPAPPWMFHSAAL